MSFKFRNLEQIGKRIDVSLPTDGRGHLGRECPQPECLGYFTIKPGTGLRRKDLPCHCPYCGYVSSHNRFFTSDQIEYAKSAARRQVVDAIRQDLKQMEFNHRPKGGFGIGISLKVQPGRPVPLHQYAEKTLETDVTCESCTLEYAVYGAYAFCPDCGLHNSAQILDKNLELIEKQLVLVSQVEDPALARHLLEDALENCVSALDGFGRETCRVRAVASTDPAAAQAVSFQNLLKAAARVQKLFGVDFASAVDPIVWETAHRGFLRRHVVAHRSGVVDQAYLDQIADPAAVVGRRVPLSSREVAQVADAVRAIGRILVAILPPPPR